MNPKILQPNRSRQIIQLCALAVGLGIFVFLGMRAVKSTADRKYVEGQRNQPVQAVPALFGGVHSLSNTISPARLGTVSAPTSSPAVTAGQSFSSSIVTAEIKHTDNQEIKVAQ